MSRLIPASLVVLLALTSLARAQNASAPGEVQFDGGRVRQGDVTVAGSPRATGATDQNAALYDALIHRLTLRPTSDPRAFLAIRAGIREMLKTNTGADLARAFVKENARASVGFGNTGESGTVDENGVKVLYGSGGYTDTDTDPPSVMLNEKFLDTGDEYRRVEVARVLAHEMMGHGFERQRIAAAGLSPAAMYYYRGDEGNASMVGWLVQTELNGKLINGNMWNYLTDPEKFYDAIRFIDPYYATTLSPKEMMDPIPVWTERLNALDGKRAQLDDDEKDDKRWKNIIAHFISAHGMDASRFSNLNSGLDYELASQIPGGRKRLVDTDKALRDALKRANSQSGQVLLSDMRTAAQSSYVAGREQRMEQYVERLRIYIGDRRRETAAPPKPGEIDWKELAEMWKKDEPAHGSLIP